jgi:hypothetical protein
MKKFTIITETFPNLAAITAEKFDGFSIVNQIGYWQGKQERSSQIVIMFGEDRIRGAEDVRQLAERIKLVNNQECVLLTEETIDAKFI